MKRFHVNVRVADLNKSIRFYETLFGEAPTVTKPDYAKWMLEDPRINFAISESTQLRGINHVGLQVDSKDELAEIQDRLDAAEEKTFRQPETQCCYATSSKTWTRDPDDVAWETFVTHGQITHYGDHSPAMPVDDNSQETLPQGVTADVRCCA
jgi:catechol 2,3-dioxygenase-like lactoylglutathione lyase family enzyme